MKRKKSGNFFARAYSDVWDYIKESRNFVWFALGVFILFSLVGGFFPIFFREGILNMLAELLLQIEGYGPLEMVVFLFGNNSLSAFWGIFLGIFVGLFPLIALVVNGYILGFVSNLAITQVGVFELWRLLPHGIFEIPAIMISFGLGIRLGFFFTAKKPGKEFVKRLKMSAYTYAFVVIPLLILAAIIEGLLIVYGV